MTTLIARQPLHPLPMSSIQREPRRSSGRLQGKDEATTSVNHGQSNGKSLVNSSHGDNTQNPPNKDVANTKKRKNVYDEEDDGFMFTRAKKRRPRVSDTKLAPSVALSNTKEPTSTTTDSTLKVPTTNGEMLEVSKKRKNKMSFATPDSKSHTVRRSKRLSNEAEPQRESPKTKSRVEKDPAAVSHKLQTPGVGISPKKQTRHIGEAEEPPLATEGHDQAEESQKSTKIALPFADTPVIRRNKAMREGKTGKSERRSSLSLRGRRASSLIDSGTSNALPHEEVAISDFYKHIESEGLPEPRRMRLLLTWCATRALDQKSIGTDFEDGSARSAARVIQEELLKDLVNQSDLSDWFSREDVPAQQKPLPERPHPKNIQNTEKIAELEVRIKRLRSERDALEKILRPPMIPESNLISNEIINPDNSLLSQSDATLLESLHSAPDLSTTISTRIKTVCESIGPTIDTFTDNILEISQYCNTAETIAGRALAICSEKLHEREREGRKRVLSLEEGEEDYTPRKDLMGVLRGLSRVER